MHLTETESSERSGALALCACGARSRARDRAVRHSGLMFAALMMGHHF